MTDDLDAVLDDVLERVAPTAEERDRLERTVEALRSRASEALSGLPVEAEAILVGSTARGTWIAGDRDVDLFVRFPADLPRDDLERYGLEVGHAVLPDGREEYAEHPYVTGERCGFDVDLVPCYDVAGADEIRSAVDRSPFHTAYVEDHLTDAVADEIRVFKAFLKGIGVYGSDLRTRGFSGYLSELLVLEYGDARSAIEAAADWHPPVELDPEDHGEAAFDDPLVVIDPTDPGRNVAAVVTAENVARLQHHARDLLSDPRPAVFFRADPTAIDAAGIGSHLDRRGTTPVALVFSTPDLVEDELYPQLRKSLEGVADELERRGFEAIRRAVAAGDRCLLLVELEVADRPLVERHAGPPVHVRSHAEDFLAAYADENVYGPFLDGDRYVVEREREFASASAFLESDALFETRLGPAVARALEAGYEVVVGEDLAPLAEEFGASLGRYFDPSP